MTKSSAMTDALPATPTFPRLRRFAVDAAITAVFNVAIALVVTYVLRIHHHFFTNLVISMCIGLLMVTFIDGGRLLLWGTGKPKWLPFSLLFVAALPSAQYLGNLLAGFLLGIPSERFMAASSRNGTGLLVVFVLTCVSITWFFWNRGHVEELKAEAEAEKARAAAIEKQSLQSQLQLLQAQIEPHMLFNTLANLQGLIAVDPVRAQFMLDQLIEYLRASLASSRIRQTSLAQEFALLQNYLELMKIRMGTRLSYGLHLTEELRHQVVPPMLLQPLVENAIKHGLEPKTEGGRIDIAATREGNMLLLSVRDNGKGLDSSGMIEGTRVGVSNVHDRLRALFGDRATFSLTQNVPQGVTAEIRMPL